MANKFSELASQRGIVVIGYAGRDHSVMSMLETLLKDDKNFPHSIYWALRPRETPSSWVQRLSSQHGERFQTVEMRDFDGFMADLHTALELELPETIIAPHINVEAELADLVKKALNFEDNKKIQEHSSRLYSQLGRPVEAELALERRDYQRAIELVQRHLAKHGPTGPSMTVWGRALEVQADEEGRDDLLREAISKLEKAIDIEPKELPQRYALAQLLVRRQMFERAIEICQALRELAPGDSRVRRMLVSIYATTHKFGAAERELDWLRRREPRAADVAAQEGAIFQARGYMSQAAERYREAVNYDALNPWLHIQLAQALVSLRQFDEAEIAFRQASKLAPDDVWLLIALVEFYFAARARPADAISLLAKAVSIDPNSVEARGRLGELYAQQSRWADAERETTAAVALAPDDSRLLSNLGVAFLNGGREREAEQAFVRARDQNPSLPNPRMWLCILYATQMRDGDLYAEMQASSRYLPPQAMQLITMQVQFLRARAMELRQRNLPTDWPQIIGPLVGAHGPDPMGGAQGALFDGASLHSGPGAASDKSRPWWQKLTGQ